MHFLAHDESIQRLIVPYDDEGIFRCNEPAACQWPYFPADRLIDSGFPFQHKLRPSPVVGGML